MLWGWDSTWMAETSFLTHKNSNHSRSSECSPGESKTQMNGSRLTSLLLKDRYSIGKPPVLFLMPQILALLPEQKMFLPPCGLPLPQTALKAGWETELGSVCLRADPLASVGIHMSRAFTVMCGLHASPCLGMYMCLQSRILGVGMSWCCRTVCGVCVV